MKMVKKDTWSWCWGKGLPCQVETYPGRLHNNRGTRYPSAGEAWRKINGVNKAGEGESFIWGREDPLQEEINVSAVKSFGKSCDAARGTGGRMAVGEVEEDALFWKGKRCSHGDFFLEKRRPILHVTWLRLHDTECDGEGVMRQLDKWQLGRLDNENLSFHSVYLKHSWKGKDGRCSHVSLCVCVCIKVKLIHLNKCIERWPLVLITWD